MFYHLTKASLFAIYLCRENAVLIRNGSVFCAKGKQCLATPRSPLETSTLVKLLQTERFIDKCFKR